MAAVLKLVDGEIDLGARRIRRGNREHRLTANEAGLLAVLGGQPGQAVSRDELLRVVWGHRAAVVTRALDQTVSRLRVKLEADPAHPHHLLTVRGVGYVFHPASAPDPEDAGLFGRTDELASLRASTARVQTLVGPPGCGKSALARAYAEQSGHRVRVVPFDHDADLMARLAAGLGVSLAGCRSQAGALERLAFALSAQRLELVLLDDLDSALDHPLLARLTEEASEVRFLLTARRAPGFGDPIAVEPLGVAAAVALFRARAGLTDTGTATLEALVTALDGLPLAIELAAARAALMPPAQMLARIDALLRILRTSTGGGLGEALAWSWAALPPDLPALLARLSAFAGPFPLEAATAVADGLGDELWVVDGLDRLRAHHLLKTAGERCGLFLAVKQYAAQQRPDDAVRGRALHEQHYARRCAPFEDRARPGYGLWSALQGEVAEVQTALAHATAHRTERAGTLALAASALLRKQLPASQRLALLDRALSGTTDTRILANVRLARSELRLRSGDRRGALRDAERARDAGPPLLAAHAWRQVALTSLAEPAAADEACARALSASDDPRSRGMTALVQGMVAQGRQDPDAARAHFDRALDAGLVCGDDELKLGARVYLGQLHRMQRQLDAAEAHYRAALELAERHGWETSLVGVLSNLGTLAYERSELADAAVWFGRARDAWQQSADPGPNALVLVKLADVAAMRGDDEAARVGYRDVHGDARYVPMVRALALSGEAFLDHRAGRAEQATWRLREAALALGGDFPSLGALLELLRAAALADSGRPDAAQRVLDEARAALEVEGDTALAVLLTEGHIAVAIGDGVAAHRALQRARARVEEKAAEHTIRQVGTGSPTGLPQSSAVTLPTPWLRGRLSLLSERIDERDTQR